VGELCRAAGALLMVDTVASLGAVPFFVDQWGVDACYTGIRHAFFIFYFLFFIFYFLFFIFYFFILFFSLSLLGGQKCLSGPPGISPITFSSRAMDKVLTT
jgi:alanine-glyoxylate transaminase/serine-glyoxylate transaminase/serine-pyruvate transaminase